MRACVPLGRNKRRQRTGLCLYIASVSDLPISPWLSFLALYMFFFSFIVSPGANVYSCGVCAVGRAYVLIGHNTEQAVPLYAAVAMYSFFFFVGGRAVFTRDFAFACPIYGLPSGKCTTSPFLFFFFSSLNARHPLFFHFL